MTATMRGGRFGSGLDPDAARFNASTAFDWRLLPHDVAGSIAHARMLARQGILPVQEADQIIAGLKAVEKEVREGTLDLDPALEDIHMNVEVHLTQKVGEAGQRLHTGRSRNDQVATDLRLYALSSCGRIIHAVDQMRLGLLGQARQHIDTVAPGYTHLQRAQPVRLAHHILAYVEMFGRDRGRFLDAARRTDVSPLGSGALAATPHKIDREGAAKDLGFSGVSKNSMDAVGDRDFAVELVAAAALCQSHLSRLAEELVLWSSQEFAFVKLPEGYCAGSSLMPQKVNPDIPELVRAKTGRVTGDLVALLMVLKGLPLAYNKDLQETQEPLYDAVEAVVSSLAIMAGLVRGLDFDEERLSQAVGAGHLVATELADYLVGKGVPFRRAHDVAGTLVRKAIEARVDLSALPLPAMQAEAPEIGPDVAEWLDPLKAVDRRDLVGGPARARVVAEIERLEKELG
jgi:argininosuccinate lyase